MNIQHWNETAQKLHEIKVERKRLEDIEIDLQKRLVLLSNNETAVGDRFIFLKDTRKGSIEYNLIPELLSVNLEKFRKPDVTIWKLGEK